MIPAGDIFWTDPCGPREPDPCPHTYGVRVCSCAAFATEPCRPTACIPSIQPPTFYQAASPDGDGWAVVATAAHFLAQSSSNHCSLITVHSSYTFSAKERDLETGLSYFGARYYSSDLSIWLSVDPMSDKYPSLSPYTYCANNPVKLVDPNGEEVGDFYDLYGNYLGTDGIKDNMVYLVQGSSTSYIKDRKTVSKDDPNINISQTTTYKDLATAIALFHSNGNNGGKKEVGGAYNSDGEWKEGEGYDDHVKLPISVGRTSIHLHTWGKNDEIGTKNYRSPENPSDKDWDSFTGFSQNIIVGKTSGEFDYSSGCLINRKSVMCFYGNKETDEPNCSIRIEAAERIVNRGGRNGRDIQPF